MLHLLFMPFICELVKGITNRSQCLMTWWKCIGDLYPSAGSRLVLWLRNYWDEMFLVFYCENLKCLSYFQRNVFFTSFTLRLWHKIQEQYLFTLRPLHVFPVWIQHSVDFVRFFCFSKWCESYFKLCHVMCIFTLGTHQPFHMMVLFSIYKCLS